MLRFWDSSLRSSCDDGHLLNPRREFSVKLLWVKAGKLLPVDTGGKIRSYNILRRLADQHQVKLLSYYPGEVDSSYEAALPRAIPGSRGHLHRYGRLRRLPGSIGLCRQIAPIGSLLVTKYTNPKVRQAVAEHLTSGKVDVAICDFLAASLNFPDELPIPCVLFQHNVESSLWQRMALTETHPLRKISYTYELARMLRYERQALARFHHILALSDYDRQQLIEMGSEVRDHRGSHRSRRGQVSSRSAIGHHPSAHCFYRFHGLGAKYRCHGIFLRRGLAANSGRIPECDLPDCRTNSLPQSAAARFRLCAGDGHGSFRHGLPARRDSSGCAAPHRRRNSAEDLRSDGHGQGSGLNFHWGRRTTFQNGRDLLLADDASSFADAILLLLRDNEARRRFEQAARDLAAQFDWSIVASQLGRVLERIAASGSEAAANANKAAATHS